MARSYDHLLIKLPSRERPAQLLRVVRLFATYCTHPQHATLLISLDTDDASVTPTLLRDLQDTAVRTIVSRGGRTTKVGAVNRDMELAPPWDLLLLASDDMVPQKHGYDETIRRYMKVHHPKGDGCLWFHDGYQDRVCTMPVMDHRYWQRDGFIYDPRFASYYADDAQTELARRRGRMRKVGECIVRHEHCVWNRAVPDDALYQHNRLHKERDRLLYQHIKPTLA